jgi:hypothetical protein
MAVVPQVITETKASGAQVIDGSLKFDGTNYLSKTFASSGDRTKWTWSGWAKRSAVNNTTGLLFYVEPTTTSYTQIGWSGDNFQLNIAFSGTSSAYIRASAKSRDPSAWAHYVAVYDSANATSTDRLVIYINGVRVTDFQISAYPSQSALSPLNRNTTHYIGTRKNVNQYFDGCLSNVYLIDGLALDASYFGYTDGLTNTWRPKKYEGTFGTNGFYLPMDGNSPIGEDQSGAGNNWTPVNFGGSVALDNPIVSGARPILNTDGGGRTARVGVFGSEVGSYYAVTVASVGGGNRYHFDGVDRPNPTLTRGATYTFDQSDSTNSNHPLRFSTTSNGSHGGGSEYTDGVVTNGTPGSAGAYTKITVPHNSADTLYYYCTNHSNMGSSTSQITDETKADPYAWKNVLALPLVGSASDVSADINATTTKKVATNSGSTSDNNSEFYGGSTNFDGSNDRITIPYSADFTFDGDFTIEYWIFREGGSVWLDFTDSGDYENGYQFYAAAGNMMFYVNSASPTQVGGSGFMDVTSSVWTHHAVTRSGTTARAFENGILKKTTTLSGTLGNNSSNVFGLGAQNYGGAQAWYDGKLSDLRIYKGVAKYTSDFVVPATSPDILPDTPSGVSGSSKLAKVTEGAVIGDGTTSDYLQVSSSGHTDFSMDGDFTVEWFYYRNSVASAFMWTVGDSGTSTGLELYWGSSGSTLKLYTNGGDSTITGDPMVGWSHYAVVRSGSTITAYYNGISGGTTSNSTTFSGNFTIGGEYYNSGITGGLSGPISNFRYIKGTALYTTDFTPPTRELTNVTNTKLLCCQSNTLAGSAAVSPNLGGVNDGTVWSRFLSSPDDPDGSESYKLFDGNISNLYSPGANTITFDITSIGGIAVSTSLEVYFSSGVSARDYSVNGGSAVNSGTGTKWVDLGFTGTFNTLTGTNGGQIGAIRIDGSTILLDPVSPVGNVAATNFNPFTTDINAVRGQETGYCTWNPLCSSSNTTLSNGNLDMSSGAAWDSCIGTIGATSGKYYWEQTMTTNQYTYTGFCNQNFLGKFESHWPGQTVDSWGYLSSSGLARNDQSGGSQVSVTLTTMPSSGGILGFALDLDNQKAWFALNGKWMGSGSPNPATGTDAVFTNLTAGDTYFPAADVYSASASFTFGQKPFKFPPPAGFQPLNAANVRPETVIARPDQYVGVTTYTGNGTSQTIGGLGFAPDFLWIKERIVNRSHGLYDTVRGSDKVLLSNDTSVELTSTARLSSINNDGFSVGSDTMTNQSGQTYVAWGWKAGGNKNTFNVDDVGYASAAAAGLDGGSLAVTGASVGTKQGFSIITYSGNNTSGATFSHGLEQSPTLVIIKARDSAFNWVVGHTSSGFNQILVLNENYKAGDTSQTGAQTQYFNDTSPSSSVVTLGNAAGTNRNLGTPETYVAYIWHDVPGLQKFGSYTGVNSTDGPFLELGFRPSIIMFKNISSGSTEWVILDNKRNGFNGTAGNNILFPSTDGDENATQYGDFLSNGWKFRINSSYVNSTDTFIYAAWAEAPTFNLYGAQSNAR